MINKILNLLDNKFSNKIPKLILFMCLNFLLEIIGISLVFIFFSFLISGQVANSMIKNFGLETIFVIENIGLIAFFLFLFFLIRLIFSLFFNYSLINFKNVIRKDLSLKLSKIYLFQSISSFNKKNSAELVKNSTREVHIFCDALIGGVLTLGLEILIVLGVVITMLYFNVASTLQVLIFIFTIVIVYIFFLKKKLQKLGSDTQINNLKILKSIGNYYSNFRDIKSSSKENFFLKNFDYLQSFQLKFLNKTLFFQVIPKLLIEFFLITIITFFLFIVSNDKNIIEQIGIIGIGLLRMLPSANKILTIWQSFKLYKSTLILLENEFSLEYIEKPQSTKNLSMPKFLQKIEFKDITFSYPQDKRGFEIEKFSFTICRGDIVSISGRSGSGKSTLADIFCGFIKPTSGQIFIDENLVCLSDISFYKNIAYASQNGTLLNDTIRNNIIFGNKFDSEKYTETLQMFNLYELFDNDKFFDEIEVGESGSMLSGGQIQRIYLARCFYNKEKKFYILDEPTNQLDAKTEINIIENIKNYIKKNEYNLIFITHNDKLNSIADKIIEISKGVISVKKN